MGDEIARYRRRGGYAGLSQLMTVHADGRVELLDRKTRRRSAIQASDSELSNLRSAIDSVPAQRWHSLGGAIARRMLPNPHEAMRFEIQTTHGRVGGASGSTEADLGPVLTQLDELLARAVREGRPDTTANP
jgi:hypothetical protein